jgi:hypothetical protein
MMANAIAGRLALDRLRERLPVVARRIAGAADREPRRGAGRARRRRARHQRLRARPGGVPSGAFDLAGAHQLTTAELWGVWTVADLESGLAFRAWCLAAPEHRSRAHGAYRAALDREARAARVLAERAAAVAAT